MVAEAEKFAAKDKAQRERIEALNAVSSFVHAQLNDNDGLGGGETIKDDKKIILSIIKEMTTWIGELGSKASTEDLEEKMAGMNSQLHCLNLIIYILFTGVHGVVNSATSKLYSTSSLF